MNFPQYRKYSNNKVFFKIISSDTFEEITLVGSKKVINIIKASTYAEKVYIMDMLENVDKRYLIIEESEYTEQLKNIG